MTTLAAIALIFIVGVAMLIAMMRSAAPDPDDTVDEFTPSTDVTALLKQWEEEDERPHTHQ